MAAVNEDTHSSSFLLRNLQSSIQQHVVVVVWQPQQLPTPPTPIRLIQQQQQQYRKHRQPLLLVIQSLSVGINHGNMIQDIVHGILKLKNYKNRYGYWSSVWFFYAFNKSQIAKHKFQINLKIQLIKFQTCLNHWKFRFGYYLLFVHWCLRFCRKQA